MSWAVARMSTTMTAAATLGAVVVSVALPMAVIFSPAGTVPKLLWGSIFNRATVDAGTAQCVRYNVSAVLFMEALFLLCNFYRHRSWPRLIMLQAIDQLLPEFHVPCTLSLSCHTIWSLLMEVRWILVSCMRPMVLKVCLLHDVVPQAFSPTLVGLLAGVMLTSSAWLARTRFAGSMRPLRNLLIGSLLLYGGRVDTSPRHQPGNADASPVIPTDALPPTVEHDHTVLTEWEPPPHWAPAPVIVWEPDGDVTLKPVDETCMRLRPSSQTLIAASLTPSTYRPHS